MLAKKRKTPNQSNSQETSPILQYSSLIEDNKIYASFSFTHKRSRFEAKKLNIEVNCPKTGFESLISIKSTKTKTNLLNFVFFYFPPSDVSPVYQNCFFLDVEVEIVINNTKATSFKLRDILPNCPSEKQFDIGREVFKKTNSDIKLDFNLSIQKCFNQYHHDINDIFPFTGLLNLGKTCYMNAFLQMLYMFHPMKEAVFNFNPYEFPFAKALQQIFTEMQQKSYEIDTSVVFEALEWPEEAKYVERDIHEFSLSVSSFFAQNNSQAYENLFQGTVINTYKCKNIDYSWEKEEKLSELSLPIADCANLADSLKLFTQAELLETPLETPHGKQEVYKQVKFKDLPSVLSISFKRFEFCPKKMEFIKLNSKVKYTEKLNLSKFSENKEDSEYELHGILIHSGTFGSGHYYCYLKPGLDGEWFLFDDKYVCPVGTEQVLANNFGGNYQSFSFEKTKGKKELKTNVHSALWSAYMLIYVKKSERERLLRPFQIPSLLDNPVKKTNDTVYVVLLTKESAIGHSGSWIFPSLFDLNKGEPLLLDLDKRVMFSAPAELTIGGLKQFIAEKGLPVDSYTMWDYSPAHSRKHVLHNSLKKSRNEDGLAELGGENGTGICFLYLHSPSVLFSKEVDFSLSNDNLVNNLGLVTLSPSLPEKGTSLVFVKEKVNGVLEVTRVFSSSCKTMKECLEENNLAATAFELNDTVIPLEPHSPLPEYIVLLPEEQPISPKMYIRCVNTLENKKTKMLISGAEKYKEIKQLLFNQFFSSFEHYFPHDYYLVDRERLSKAEMCSRITWENIWVDLNSASTAPILSLVDIGNPEIKFGLVPEKTKQSTIPVEFSTVFCSQDGHQLLTQQLIIQNPRVKFSDLVDKYAKVMHTLNPSEDYYFPALVHSKERIIEDVCLDDSVELFKLKTHSNTEIRFQPFSKAYIDNLFSGNYFKLKKVFLAFHSRNFTGMTMKEPTALFFHEEDSLSECQRIIKTQLQLEGKELVFFEVKQQNEAFIKEKQLTMDTRLVQDVFKNKNTISFVIEM